MNKKEIILATVLISTLLIAVPLVQALLFSVQSEGKMVREHSIEAPFLEKPTKKYQLLFFGYVGCTDICTPVLNELNQMVHSQSFAKIKNDVDIVFVNLIPSHDIEQPQLFASYFNKNFIGVHLEQKELMQIDRGFGLYFSQRLDSKSDLDHGDNLYLLSKNSSNTYTLHNIYSTHPINTQLLISDIESQLQENGVDR